MCMSRDPDVKPPHSLICHRCTVDVHLCGESCKLTDKKGCLGGCTKVWMHPCLYHWALITPHQVSNHSDEDHMCSARIHACGEVRPLKPTVTDSKQPPAL